MTLIEPEMDPTKGGRIVVLEKVNPPDRPDYHTCGKVTCWRCGDWCWLGTETYKLVVDERVCPMCRECAKDVLPANLEPIRNAGDGPCHH